MHEIAAKQTGQRFFQQRLGGFQQLLAVGLGKPLLGLQVMQPLQARAALSKRCANMANLRGNVVTLVCPPAGRLTKKEPIHYLKRKLTVSC